MKAPASLACAALICAACGGGGGVRAPSGRGAVADSHPSDAPALGAKTGGRTLVVHLASDGVRLHVRIAATGTPSELRLWQLGEDAVEHLEVRDGSEGVVPFERRGGAIDIAGAGSTIALSYDVVSASPPRPAVSFESAEAMDVASRAAAVALDEDASATLIEAARFRVVGERVLALPAAYESKAVSVSLDVHGGPDTRLVATSFGIAIAIAKEKAARAFVLETSGAALRRAAFLGGPGGRAEFDAVEGHDESAWLGYPAFDPRAVSAEVAGFRGVLHDYFKDYDLHPATLFFVVDPRPRGHFRVLRRASGVLVTLGNDPYDAPLRLAVAHELVHAWIGERIWLGDASPGHEAESFWFHEGFTRWIAREQLARVGLLSSDEYAAESNRLLAIVTTSRHAARGAMELAADRTTPGVVPLLVARGALYATVIDARIREASHGARSLDDAIRALARQADERRGPLPANALRDLLVTELGEAHAKEDFDDVVLAGRRTKLPEAALGPCFESRDISYDVYAPGFDVAASRAAHAIVGLDPKGPAAAAGVRDHDALVSDDVPERTDQTAKLQLERAGKTVLVTYRPTSGTKRGQGFRRKPALTEEACRKLALRR